MFMRDMILLSSASISSASASTLMIVADEVEKTMHREMGEVMQKNPVFIVAFAGERLVGDDDIAEELRADAVRVVAAGNDSTLVGLSMPRHCAIERANRRVVGQHDSSLRRRAVESAAAAAAMASRTVCSAAAARPTAAIASGCRSTARAARRFGAAVISWPRARPSCGHRLRRCAPPARGGSRPHG